ncbi:DUF3489 domain-containing protein [uncultured Erythrobacter sp.]|uniref:DUF3489 domain-containing protein n=1 Tax=uncultured Erythrobacter sp. TaxID=263913 RepID=UPI00262588BB|nr:DUF3489 domain-containing protein [uncultured Erythrobacter sp.]
MSKKAKLIQLMKRKEGVSLADASKALEWQPHTVRAAISRLRKDGHAIELTNTAKGNRYVLKAGDDA